MENVTKQQVCLRTKQEEKHEKESFKCNAYSSYGSYHAGRMRRIIQFKHSSKQRGIICSSRELSIFRS